MVLVETLEPMNPFYTSHISKTDCEDFQSFCLGVQFYDNFLCAEQVFICMNRS